MADSLDLLLTRQVSMGRRAAAMPAPASPANHMQSPSSRSARTTDASVMYASSKDALHSPSSGYKSQTYNKESEYPTRTSSSSSYYEKEVPRSPLGHEYAKASPLSPSASPSSAQTLSAGGSNSGSVDWSSFRSKQQRAGSAHATVAAHAAAPSNFVPSSVPKSAAAGLSDGFIASRQQNGMASPARPAPAAAPTGSGAAAPARQSDDSTVIGGAVIPALHRADSSVSLAVSSAPTAAAVNRNPFAAASPLGGATRPSASPFATASSPAAPVRAAPLVGGGVLSPSGASATALLAADPSIGQARQIQTFSCPDCGRRFKRGSLVKHQRVCKKVFASKREKFDSSKVRTQDLPPEHQRQEGEDDDDECEEDDEDDATQQQLQRPRTAAPKPKAAGGKKEESKEAPAAGGSSKPGGWKDASAGLREAMRRAKKEKACFAQSSALGIDMGKMMMRR